MIRHLASRLFQTHQARRRVLTVAAMVLPAILSAGCSGKHPNPEVQNDEGDTGKAPLVAMLKMSDPSAKTQLTKGFYPLEANAWRWTAGDFSVVLKTPPGAAQKGATLTLALNASDAVLKQVHSQTLTAAIGTTTLKSEKYVDPGAHTFTADIPAASLAGDTVTIDFSLDNSLPPGPGDRRELGVIVTTVGIETN